MPNHKDFLKTDGLQKIIKSISSNRLLNPSKYYIVEIIGILCQDPSNISKLEQEPKILTALYEFSLSNDKELKQAALSVLTNAVAVSSRFREQFIHLNGTEGICNNLIDFERSEGVELGLSRLLACIYDVCKNDRYMIILQVTLPFMHSVSVEVSALNTIFTEKNMLPAVKWSSLTPNFLVDNFLESTVQKRFNNLETLLVSLEIIISSMDFSCDEETMKHTIYFFKDYLEPLCKGIVFVLSLAFLPREEEFDVDSRDLIVLSAVKLLAALIPLQEFRIHLFEYDLWVILTEVARMDTKYLVDCLRLLGLTAHYGFF